LKVEHNGKAHNHEPGQFSGKKKGDASTKESTSVKRKSSSASAQKVVEKKNEMVEKPSLHPVTVPLTKSVHRPSPGKQQIPATAPLPAFLQLPHSNLLPHQQPLPLPPQPQPQPQLQPQPQPQPQPQQQQQPQPQLQPKPQPQRMLVQPKVLPQTTVSTTVCSTLNAVPTQQHTTVMPTPKLQTKSEIITVLPPPPPPPPPAHPVLKQTTTPTAGKSSTKTTTKTPKIKEEKNPARRRSSGLKLSPDGYKWRKYGEKPICGTGGTVHKHYFRCTVMNCEARRFVIYNETTKEMENSYSGEHTNHPINLPH